MSQEVVIFDTNMLKNPTVFESVVFRATRRLCKEVGLELAITAITLDESVNLQTLAAKEAINNLDKSSRALGAILEMSTYIPDLDDVIDRWRETLSDNFRILDLNGLDAVEALRREALRIFPAKKNGTGARDCAIWLTALRLAGEGSRVILVSKNVEDFGRGGRLHPSLRTEVEKNSLSLEYANSLEELLGLISSPPTEAISMNIDDALRILGYAVRLQVSNSLQGSEGGEVTVDTYLDANIRFSDLQVVNSYQVEDFVVSSIRFDFSIDLSQALSVEISASGESFVKYETSSNDFEVSSYEDVSLINVDDWKFNSSQNIDSLMTGDTVPNFE